MGIIKCALCNGRGKISDLTKNDTVRYVNCRCCNGTGYIESDDHRIERKFKNNFEFVVISIVSGLLILNFNARLDRYSMVWWILTNVGFGFIGLGILMEYFRLNHEIEHKQ